MGRPLLEALRDGMMLLTGHDPLSSMPSGAAILLVGC